MERPTTPGSVQTVLGPVPAGQLGIILPHEHLLADLGAFYREPDGATGRGRGREPVGARGDYEVHYEWTRNRDNLQLLDERTAIEEALLYRLEGGQTLVDATTRGIGRDPLALQRIARASGLHIVMGAGYYVGRAHPADMESRTEDTLTREIIHDLCEGVEDTGVRAGIIGEIGCSWPVTSNERKSLRASAEAAKVTGAPLMIHPGIHEAAPQAHLDEVRRTGLDLRRVVMCHVDRTVSEPSWLEAIAESGCYLEFDHFGKEISFFPLTGADVPSDAERIRRVLWLIERGYGRQVLLSQDVAFKTRLVQYGGHGYRHILRHIVPRLRRRGLSADEVDMLLRANPAAMLAPVTPPNAGASVERSRRGERGPGLNRPRRQPGGSEDKRID